MVPGHPLAHVLIGISKATAQLDGGSLAPCAPQSGKARLLDNLDNLDSEEEEEEEDRRRRRRTKSRKTPALRFLKAPSEFVKASLSEP